MTWTYGRLYHSMRGNGGTDPLAIAANALAARLICAFDANTGNPNDIVSPGIESHTFEVFASPSPTGPRFIAA